MRRQRRARRARAPALAHTYINSEGNGSKKNAPEAVSLWSRVTGCSYKVKVLGSVPRFYTDVALGLELKAGDMRSLSRSSGTGKEANSEPCASKYYLRSVKDYQSQFLKNGRRNTYF